MALDSAEQIENTWACRNQTGDSQLPAHPSRSRYGPAHGLKDRSMTVLLIALVAVLAAATAVVLADSGLRLWSAARGIALERSGAVTPALRAQRAVRVATRISYSRGVVAAPRRAAA